jgi:hypothetical protein
MRQRPVHYTAGADIFRTRAIYGRGKGRAGEGAAGPGRDDFAPISISLQFFLATCAPLRHIEIRRRTLM